MHDLVYELKRMVERNRDGSYTTQYDRKRMLMLFGTQLINLGYAQMHATDLRGRHVNKLLALWATEGIAAATMANRLSALRYWAEKVGKPGILARRNAVYGIAARVRVASTSDVQPYAPDRLARIPDPLLRISVRLQKAFGLRREEALKIRVFQADQGAKLVLQASWCKGGRSREIPVRTQEQRDLLTEAKQLVKVPAASLIPAHLTYIQQRRRFDYWTAKVGLGHMHSQRHVYAQERYADLTGFPCPHRGGPTGAEMTPTQRCLDEEARQVVSTELGHGRLEITQVYLG